MLHQQNISAVGASRSFFPLRHQLFTPVFPWRPDTHPALLAVGQELVLLLGVEDERVRGEGDGLSLEGRALVGADEQHLIPFVYGRTHQHHLEEGQTEEGGVRGQR